MESSEIIALEPLPANFKSNGDGICVVDKTPPSEDADSQGTEEVAQPEQSLWAAVLIIATLSGITFASSMTTGLLAISLPTMAVDLGIPDGLLLW